MRCQRSSAPRVYCVRPLTQPPLPMVIGTSVVADTVMRLRSGRIVQSRLPCASFGASVTDVFAASSAISACASGRVANSTRSQEHTSELQSLMRISYAVFCLKKETHILYHHFNFGK